MGVSRSTAITNLRACLDRSLDRMFSFEIWKRPFRRVDPERWEMRGRMDRLDLTKYPEHQLLGSLEGLVGAINRVRKLFPRLSLSEEQESAIKNLREISASSWWEDQLENQPSEELMIKVMDTPLSEPPPEGCPLHFELIDGKTVLAGVVNVTAFLASLHELEQRLRKMSPA